MSLRSTLSPWAWAASLTCLTVDDQTTTDSGAHGDPQSPDPNVPRQSQQPAGFQTVKGRGPAISAVPPPQSELPGGGEVVAGKYLPRPRRAFHQRRPSRSRLVGLPLSVGKDLAPASPGVPPTPPAPSVVEPPAAGPAPLGPVPAAVRARLGRWTFGFAGHKQPQLAPVITVGRRHKLCRQPSVHSASAGTGAQGADGAKAAAGGQPTGLPPQTAPLTQPLANTPLAAQPPAPTPPPAPAPVPDAPHHHPARQPPGPRWTRCAPPPSPAPPPALAPHRRPRCRSDRHQRLRPRHPWLLPVRRRRPPHR